MLVIVLVLPEVGAGLWSSTHIASSPKESATWGNQPQLAQCPADYTSNKRFSHIYTWTRCLFRAYPFLFYTRANHFLASELALNLLQITQDSRNLNPARSHLLLTIKDLYSLLYSRYYSIIIGILLLLVIYCSYIMPRIFSLYILKPYFLFFF